MMNNRYKVNEIRSRECAKESEEALAARRHEEAQQLLEQQLREER